MSPNHKIHLCYIIVIQNYLKFSHSGLSQVLRMRCKLWRWWVLERREQNRFWTWNWVWAFPKCLREIKGRYDENIWWSVTIDVIITKVINIEKLLYFLILIFIVSGDLIVINRFCSTIDTLKVQQGCQFNPDSCEKFNEGMKS